MVSAQAQSTDAQHEDEYEVLRSFFKWRRTQGEAPLDGNDQSAGNTYARRSAMSPELSISAKERVIVTPISSNKRPIATRLLRTIVYGVIVAVLVFVGWQAYHDKAIKKVISAWMSSSAAWVSSLHDQPPINSKVGTTSAGSLDQPAAAASTSAEATEANNLSREIQQQLQTIAGDLAVVRRTVEQLANKQEQMAQEIASLQATEQNASKTVSSIAQTVTRIQRRSSQNAVRPEHGQQPASASPITTQSATINTPATNTPPAQ
jgi:uncharacterized protein YoxC